MEIIKEPFAQLHRFDYRTPRFLADFHFLVTPAGGGEAINAHCSSISATGIGAELEQALRVGDEVLLLLPAAPGLPSAKIRSQVAHRRDQHHGFCFMLSTTPEREWALEACRIFAIGG